MAGWAQRRHIYHPQDGGAEEAVNGYRDLLADPEVSFLDLRLDRVVAAWAPVALRYGHEEWLRKLSSRYLGLELSEAAWKAHRALLSS